MDNGEIHIFGESIFEKSLNFIPIHFKFDYKKYEDTKGNTGIEVCIYHYLLLSLYRFFS